MFIDRRQVERCTPAGCYVSFAGHTASHLRSAASSEPRSLNMTLLKEY